MTSLHDLLVCSHIVCHELVDVVFITSFVDINKVIRYVGVVHMVIGQVFSRPNIHAPKHLSRVSTDYFAAQPIGQLRRQRGLTRRGGSQYGQQVRVLTL